MASSDDAKQEARAALRLVKRDLSPRLRGATQGRGEAVELRPRRGVVQG